jgi:hypothetical protein
MDDADLDFLSPFPIADFQRIAPEEDYLSEEPGLGDQILSIETMYSVCSSS